MSDWFRYNYDLKLLPQPKILGKQLNVTTKNGEYYISWPTIFDGPVGGVISKLDGIPLLEGGSFSMGGPMPSMESEQNYLDKIILQFDTYVEMGSSTESYIATKKR